MVGTIQVIVLRRITPLTYRLNGTKELDLQSIVKIENKVQVYYTWVYSDYAEEDYPDDLPFEWTTESETGTIDQDDWLTWPSIGRVEWYENGELVKIRNWEYGKEWM